MPPTVAAAPGRETVFSDATVNYFRDAAIMYPDAVEGKSNYTLVADTFRAAGIHVEHSMSYYRATPYIRTRIFVLRVLE